MNDLRFAFRQLAKAPGFTGVAVLALALGIATATTMFTFYSALMVRPFPFLKDEATLVTLRTYDTRNPTSRWEFSLPDFRDVRRESKTLSGALTTMNRTYILTGGDRPERVLGSWITVDAFQTLGVQPHLGRLFRPEEEIPGASQVALLGYGFWKRSFGGRPDIVGESVVLNQERVTVIGVMPEGFRFPEYSDVWQPFPLPTAEKPEYRGSHGQQVWARLRPGATLEQARAELDTLGARLSAEHPTTNAHKSFWAQPLRESATGELALSMNAMLGCTVAVLLIACANVANLLLARASVRSRELALRAALGATRGRLVRQVLTESLALGALGGLAGFVFTFWQLDFVLGFIPVEMPFWLRFDTDWRVMAFAVAATLGACVVFGLFPALQISQPNLVTELKEGGRGGTEGRPAQRLRSALVVAQLALTLVLLVVAGLMVRSFLKLRSLETGIDPRGVFTFRVGLPPTMISDEAVTRDFFDKVEAQLRAMPGVEHVGFISYAPVSNNANHNSFAVEGRPTPRTNTEAPQGLLRAASPGTFAALRIPLQRGRLFGPHDTKDKPRVAVVDERFAAQHFPGEDPVGRRVSFNLLDTGKDREWTEIVGIVGNVRQRPARTDEPGGIWVPFAQTGGNFMTAMLRVQGDPASYAEPAQAAVLAVRPDIPIYNTDAMTKIVSDAFWRERFFGGLFASFAGIALFLAAIGIYGVMAYSVAQRTQEIGVRMALGAPPAAVIRMVLRQGLVLVGLGLALGFAGAWVVAQLLARLLTGIEPHDPPTFLAVPLLLATVALAACWFPSRRATRVDPLVALRSE